MTTDRAIKITDDLRQERPLAYLVLMYETFVNEYQVFTDEQEARRCADWQEEKHQNDKGEWKHWKVYPLYAFDPQ